MKRINVFSVELVKESAKLYDLESKIIREPKTAYEIIEAVFSLGTKTKEYFGMLSLSSKNVVIGAHILHIGTIDRTHVSPRDIFQQALLNNAASIIVFHCHPSGVPVPSPEDIEVTKRLVSGGKLLDIEVLDHLIIGHGKFLSLNDKGFM